MVSRFNNLADLFRVQGRYTEAELYYKRALPKRHWDQTTTTSGRCSTIWLGSIRSKVARPRPSHFTNALSLLRNKHWARIPRRLGLTFATLPRFIGRKVASLRQRHSYNALSLSASRPPRTTHTSPRRSTTSPSFTASKGAIQKPKPQPHTNERS
jgi:hypothetical protein